MFKFAGSFASFAGALGVVLGIAFLILLFTVGIVGAIIIPGIILAVFTLIDAIIPIELFLKWGLVFLMIVIMLLGIYSILRGIKLKNKPEENVKVDKDKAKLILDAYINGLKVVIDALRTFEYTAEDQIKYENSKNFHKLANKYFKRIITYYEDALHQTEKIGKPNSNRI